MSISCRDEINNIITILKKSYDGEINQPDIQKLKGMIREFEEELVWAYFGIETKNVQHLRLGFYTGDVFTEQPNTRPGCGADPQRAEGDQAHRGEPGL